MTDDTKDEGNTDESNKEEVKLTEDEERALNLGWKPKEQWQGDPNDWVPAKWWLKYGDVEQRLQAAEAEAKHKEKVLGTMKNYYTRVKEDAVAEVRAQLQRAKREAVKNEDYEKVAQLDANLQDLENGLKTKFEQVDKEVSQNSPPAGPPPEFYAWNRENSWYHLGSQDEMTAEADSLAIAYMARNPNAHYTDMLNHVGDRIKKLFPDKFKKEESPMTAVDDGGGETGGKAKTGGTKLPKLTAEEKEVAARFGMSEEEYAKEKVKFEQRKGF